MCCGVIISDKKIDEESQFGRPLGISMQTPSDFPRLITLVMDST